MADTTDGVPEASASPPEELVPVWLAVLVLVLLLAVVGTAGYAIRAAVARTAPPRDAADFAVRTAAAALAAHPDDSGAHLDLGFAYQQADRFDDAIAQYEAVLRADSKNTAALYNEGMVYVERGDDKKAEELLWRVLKVDDTHALAAKALGEYYAGKKQYRSLLVAVKPAADARPDMADLQYLMGLAYEHTGHQDWAAVRYRAALTYVPDMPEPKAGLKRLGETP